jgi:hypothetical protein
MTPALLEKIIQLVESGATVLGAPPISSPSLSDYPQCDVRVIQLAEKLWGKAPYTQERALGKGRVLLDSAAPQLAQENIAEDAPLLPGTGRWIWYAQGNPAISAPAGDVHFRYSLDIGDESRLEKALVEATADNSFTLQANGNQMLAGDNFHKVYSADITSGLKSGQNEITVTANNTAPMPIRQDSSQRFDLRLWTARRKSLEPMRIGMLPWTKRIGLLRKNSESPPWRPGT